MAAKGSSWTSWLFGGTSTSTETATPTIHDPKRAELNIAIPDVDERIWKNPYYPLNGPPKDEKEAMILRERIAQESSIVNDGLHAFHSNKDAIMDRIAKDNCADLIFDTATCVRNLKFYQFFSFCHEAREKMGECITIQKRNLDKLGYSIAKPFTIEERRAMIRKADDMYLAEMKAKSENTI